MPSRVGAEKLAAFEKSYVSNLMFLPFVNGFNAFCYNVSLKPSPSPVLVSLSLISTGKALSLAVTAFVTSASTSLGCLELFCHQIRNSRSHSIFPTRAS